MLFDILIIITLQFSESLHMCMNNIIHQRVVYDQKFNHKNDIYYQSYELGKQLGKGGFANVYEIFKTNQISTQPKAVKVLSIKDQTSQNKEKIQNEIKLMQFASQNSDRFVKYYHSFTYAEKVYIIMELCEWGSMGDVFKKRKFLTQPQVRYFIQQLVEILLQLKKKGIVHRDIKPANIMISSNFKFKLGDFGLAIRQSEISKLKSMCGTPNYLAPQVIIKKSYSYEVDLWAMGVMMFSVLYGIAPFQTKKIEQTYERIKKGAFKFEGPFKSLKVSQQAKSLIKDILKIDPSQRIKLDEIPMHPFLCSYEIPRNLDKQLLQTPPTVEFVRKYMKKICLKNYKKPLVSTQNNSETTLEKKMPSSPKVTYRNSLPKLEENQKSINEYRASPNKVKIQQCIDLQQSKIQTSTSMKKRVRSPVGYNPTPKKMFRNNRYVKNQLKIEEPEQIKKRVQDKRKQEQIIKKLQEIKVEEKDNIKEFPQFFKLKSISINRLQNYKEKRRSLRSSDKSQQPFFFQNIPKQQQSGFFKARPETVIWSKIMSNGDFLYKMSSQRYGVLFKDQTQATTKDFSIIKFNTNSDQAANIAENKFKLDSKKPLFRFYKKYFPKKSNEMNQSSQIVEPINYLKKFAQIGIGRFFIFDKGILQFRHNNRWTLTYVPEGNCFFYEDKQLRETVKINRNNLKIQNKQTLSRFFEFMEATKSLIDTPWACNGWEVREVQIKERTTPPIKFECQDFQRLVV